MFGAGIAERDLSADELLAVDVDSLTDGELSDHLLALDRLRSRTEAAFRRVAARWDARQVWGDDGAPNGAVWLAHRAGMSGAVARTEIRTARRVRDFDDLGAASDSGALCSSKIRVLANAADPTDEPIAKAFERDQAMLIDHAKKLTVDQTARLLRYWRANADEAAQRADTERLHDERRVHLSQTFADRWVLDGSLEPEAGVIVAGALEQIGEELYRAERSAAEDGIVRSTASQRRADALVEMARRALAADPDESIPAKPLVAVTVDLPTLESRAGHPAELDLHGTITAESARRLACEAGIVRVITDPKGEPLDIGRTSYTPTLAQRRALTRRDRGCVFPGCDRPPGWCQSHHLVHWPKGGPSDMANLALLCSHHHHLVHEGGWAARRLPDGELQFTRPNGIVLVPPEAP